MFKLESYICNIYGVIYIFTVKVNTIAVYTMRYLLYLCYVLPG